MKKLILVAVLLIGALIWPTTVSAIESGEIHQFRDFCQTLEATEALANAATLENDIGYSKALEDPDIACYRWAVATGQFLTVQLKNKVFSITRADGYTFDFWSMMDQYGRAGYIWVHVPEPVIEGISL